MYFIEVVRLHCKAIIDSLLYCTAGGLNPRFIDDDSNDDSVCVAELFCVLLKLNPDMVCNVILECGKIEEQQPGGSRAILQVLPIKMIFIFRGGIEKIL